MTHPRPRRPAAAKRQAARVFSPARLAFALRRYLFARAEPRDPDDDADDDVYSAAATTSSSNSASTALVVKKPKPKKKGAVAATAQDLVAMTAASLEVCINSVVFVCQICRGFPLRYNCSM